MKIAIASNKSDLSGEVYTNAGRSPFYLIFEGKKLVKVLKNPFAVGGGGAGFGVVKMLQNEGVEYIIAGKFGPNMISSMDENSIKYDEFTGKVENALEKALN